MFKLVEKMLASRGYALVKVRSLEKNSAELNNLRTQNALLKAKVEQMEKRKAEEMLQDYRYAILIEKNNVAPSLWNDGRFEPRIKELHFHAHPGEVPEINIYK